MQRKSIILYVLLAVSIEKTIQHIVVAVSLAWNVGSLRSTLAVDYSVVMVVSAALAMLFGMALAGLRRKRAWSVSLLGLLGASDIVGEFIVQGGMVKVVTVSLIVAVVLLIVAMIAYRMRIMSRPG